MMDEAEKFGSDRYPDSAQNEAGETRRTHSPAIEEDAMGTFEDTDQAVNPCKHDASIEKYHEVTKVIIEAQDDGECLSKPSPCLHTEKKVTVVSPPCLHTEKKVTVVSPPCLHTEKKVTMVSPASSQHCQKAQQHFKLLRFALSKTRCRLRRQSERVERVQNSVSKISTLVKDLRKENMITAEGQKELDVALVNIFDHINEK